MTSRDAKTATNAPNLKTLAARSARFANTYTASPLCAPGRAGFMSGQLPSRTGVYDNAAEFTSSIPTCAHHLRRAGYQTCLSGKMHFVGPDQMHGFEERLATDIYPADFGWTPDYRKPGERGDWRYHNMGSVTGAGVAEISSQMEYDDEVASHACAKLYDLARGFERTTPVAMEYAAEASYAPMVSLRYGKWKYTRCALDPDQLFDLETDLAAYDADMRESQARRRVVYEALRNGKYYPWDYQPLQKASERYMRNHMKLDTLEDSKRFPRGG